MKKIKTSTGSKMVYGNPSLAYGSRILPTEEQWQLASEHRRGIGKKHLSMNPLCAITSESPATWKILIG